MKDFEEYKNHVIDLLADSLRKQIEDDNSGDIVLSNYCDEKSDPALTYDVVVLNQNKDIIKVFDVCTFHDYRRCYHLNIGHLELIKSFTNAEIAYLAFIDQKGRLQITSLNRLYKEKKPTIPFVANVNESYTEFYEIIKEWCGAENWDRSKFFFRGHSNKEYKPIPGIYRDQGLIKTMLNNEHHLYYEAIRRKPLDFTPEMSAFDNLVKMQHYGLPTRLLDVTSNPLVALYFACQEAKTKDGVEADGEVLVFSMFQEQIKYYVDDVVCLLANLAKRPISFDFSDRKERSYLYEDTHKDSPSFNKDDMWDKAIHEVYCVLPKLNNDRIIKQDGAFFIYGMEGNTKKKMALMPDKPSEIIIKASAKKDILKELELLGITEASLFPETDKVMQQIKNEYCEN